MKKTVKTAKKTINKPLKTAGKPAKKPAAKTTPKTAKPGTKKTVKTSVKPVKKTAKPVVKKESKPEITHIPEVQPVIPEKPETAADSGQDLSLPEGSVYQQTGQRRPLIVFPK
jgi:hypothetical protein